MSTPNKTEDALSLPILINSTHYVPGTDSTYRYNFPSGGTEFQMGDTASLTSINIFYSWYNISAYWGNNTFTISFGATPYVIVIPDGHYSINDLDSYIQHYCIDNGLYLVNNLNQHVYYIQISANSTFYRIQLNLKAIDASLPTGWTNPGGFAFTGAPNTPQITIPDNFSNIVGFVAGTYPPVLQATDYSVLGTLTPQVSPVQAVLVRSNILSSRYSNPSNLLAIFSVGNQDVAFGSLIEYEPNDYSYISIRNGKYEFIEISFVDQLFRPLRLLDTDLTIMILLKIKR